MRTLIRRWLGLDKIEEGSWELSEQIRDLRVSINKLIETSAVHNLAVGRIIAKKELYFGVPEDDPKRRAESDALGEAVIKRLKGEYIATRKHNF